jgi:hypothetical protein
LVYFGFVITPNFTATTDVPTIERRTEFALPPKRETPSELSRFFAGSSYTSMNVTFALAQKTAVTLGKYGRNFGNN